MFQKLFLSKYGQTGHFVLIRGRFFFSSGVVNIVVERWPLQQLFSHVKHLSHNFNFEAMSSPFNQRKSQIPQVSNLPFKSPRNRWQAHRFDPLIEHRDDEESEEGR